jgi:hypothetical protein
MSTIASGLDLYWIPLGAGPGGAVVRWSGRLYEALTATLARRPRCRLYHAALLIHLDNTTIAVEMAPVWTHHGDRGVVAEGPVASPVLGRSRLFRYEIRCWNGGSIPDLAAAEGDPIRVTDDPSTAQRIIELVPQFPILTWGRDELQTSDMWNSNSLISWLLARADVDMGSVGPPAGGRAPGWEAGLRAASSLQPIDPIIAGGDVAGAHRPSHHPREGPIMATANRSAPAIAVTEDPGLVPLCPSCDAELTTISARPLRASGRVIFWFGRRYVYACPHCHKTIGVTHRKGFWMG